MNKYAIFTNKISLATADRLSPIPIDGFLSIPMDNLTPGQRAWFDRPKHCDRFMRSNGRSWVCRCKFTQIKEPKPIRTPVTAERNRDRAKAFREAQAAMRAERDRLRADLK